MPLRETLIVGDVHGCAVELQEMIERYPAERIVLVGDLFTKGPDPLGVWRLIEAFGLEAVMGNHDHHVLVHSKLSLPPKAKAYLASLPLSIQGTGWRVVHAGVDPITHEINQNVSLSVRRWPNDSLIENPFWWQLYKGDELIIYGHDAARGLQDHRPYTLGIDTGCVYGNMLTGYSPELDEIYTVTAKAQYAPIKIKPMG